MRVAARDGDGRLVADAQQRQRDERRPLDRQVVGRLAALELEVELARVAERDERGATLEVEAVVVEGVARRRHGACSANCSAAAGCATGVTALSESERDGGFGGERAVCSIEG